MPSDEHPPMTATDRALTSLAQGRCALSLPRGRIEAHIERALEARHDLSLRSPSCSTSSAAGTTGRAGTCGRGSPPTPSPSAAAPTTRLVARLEERRLLSRLLCPTDRRGIHTDVTCAGPALLHAARPTNETALREALDAAATDPEPAPLVHVVERLPATPAAPPGGAGPRP